jgi:hypothetical protein
MKMKILACVAGVLLLMNVALLPCTFFKSTLNGVTFFGNNEDSHMSQTNVWFIPAKE